MGYRIIVNSVGADKLTAGQRATLKSVLERRKGKLETALAEVEAALDKLKAKKPARPQKRPTKTRKKRPLKTR